ncbi:6279_t:CDS:1, partial [Funneliformis caledonium]
NDKVLVMSQLQMSINFSLREKELQQNQVKFLDSNVSPIETDSEVLVEEIDDIDEDNTFITSEHWEQELNEWEEMLKEEELAQLEEEEELKDNPNISMRSDL